MKPAKLLKLSTIKSFIFGGMSSRFWMVRKLINEMGNQFEELPFYAWQCITLQLEVHSLDLIIENNESMRFFQEFLAYELCSIDGERDSFIPANTVIMEELRRRNFWVF